MGASLRAPHSRPAQVCAVCKSRSFTRSDSIASHEGQVEQLAERIQEKNKMIQQLQQRIDEVLQGRGIETSAPPNVQEDMKTRGPHALESHFRRTFEEAIGAFATIEKFAIGTGIPGAAELSIDSTVRTA